MSMQILAKRKTAKNGTLSGADLRRLDALWRASSHLSVGQHDGHEPETRAALDPTRAFHISRNDPVFGGYNPHWFAPLIAMLLPHGTIAEYARDILSVRPCPVE